MAESRKGQENFSSTAVINLCKLHSNNVEQVELAKAQELTLLCGETLSHKTDDCCKDWYAVVA